MRSGCPLIEEAGYSRQRDFLSAYIPGDFRLPERVREIAEQMKQRRGFAIKTFASKSELRSWVPRIVQTYNDTFVKNWEFNPITPKEGRVIGERLLQIADPTLIKLVMKGDQIAGFLAPFRGLGVNAILYAEMERTIRDGQFEHADLVQMEEHVLTVQDAGNLGARFYKKHRIYEKALV